MQMKFGLFGGARVNRSGPESDSQGYDTFINYVVEAEALGFEHLFMVEHHFTGMGQVSSSLSLLAYLAARTSRIRLGTGVVVLPWHNPVLVAEQAATLDLLSNGRLDLGVGRGYRKAEFEGFCIPMEEAQERFDEAIEVIRKAWTSPGRFSYHGKRWNYDNIVVEPPVMQQPHPPLWMAAVNPPGIRRAAQEGYNLLLDQVASIEQIGERIAIFREECRATARPYRSDMVGVTRGLYWAPTAERRLIQAGRRAEIMKSIGAIRQPGEAMDPAQDNAPLFGSVEEIIERLQKLAAVGVGLTLVSDPSGEPETLRTFAREVMPAVNAKSVFSSGQRDLALSA
jgi:alkanesulfonate monooxygenase SsuD/methylene tetrahydromethanopterin reductase-like flavin-dependent oxidoreductase (luciferase family)